MVTPLVNRTVLGLMLAVLITACDKELPLLSWKLIETGTTTEDVLGIWLTPSKNLYVAMSDGSIKRLKDGSRTFEEVSMIDEQGRAQTPGNTKGFAGVDDGELYAWTQGSVWHSTGGSFRSLAMPPGALAWHPRHSVSLGRDHLLTAAELILDGGIQESLLEARQRTFATATLDGGALPSVTWVAGAWDTAVLAGDGRSDARVLMRRNSDGWTVINNFAIGGAHKGVVTREHVVVLTDGGVRGARLASLNVEDSEVSLDGDFHDLCGFGDGRLAVVGAAEFPGFPVWVLDNGKWSNVNVGTRETLKAVHCGLNGKIYAGGKNGMLIVEP